MQSHLLPEKLAYLLNAVHKVPVGKACRACQAGSLPMKCQKAENEAPYSSVIHPYSWCTQAGVFTWGSCVCSYSLFHGAKLFVCWSCLMYYQKLRQFPYMSLTNIYQVPECARHCSSSKRKTICACIGLYSLQNFSFNFHNSLENGQ